MKQFNIIYQDLSLSKIAGWPQSGKNSQFWLRKQDGNKMHLGDRNAKAARENQF